MTPERRNSVAEFQWLASKPLVQSIRTDPCTFSCWRTELSTIAPRVQQCGLPSLALDGPRSSIFAPFGEIRESLTVQGLAGCTLVGQRKGYIEFGRFTVKKCKRPGVRSEISLSTNIRLGFNRWF